MAKFTKVLNPHSREKEIHIIDRYLSNVVMSAKQNTTEEPGFSPERAQREYDEFQHIKAGDFPVVITEKLDGENFRVGYDKEKGGYIGQRNNMWRTDFEDVETKHHPHWNKINIEDKTVIQKLQSIAQKMIEENKIMDYTNISVHNKQYAFLMTETMQLNTQLVLPSAHRQEIVDVTFFGELIGNSLQKRFDWVFDDYRVAWYDGSVTVRYADDRDDMEYILGFRFMEYLNVVENVGMNSPGELLSDTIPQVFHPNSKKLSHVELADNATTLNVKFHQFNDVAEYLKEHVDDMAPITPAKQRYAPEGERGVGEGWVVSLPHPHRFDRSVRVKFKSERFAEQENKNKTAKKKYDFESTFDQFLTKARVEHAVQAIAERKQIDYEDVDIRMTGDVIKQTLNDIAEEENGGEPLPKPEVRFCSSIAARIFKIDILK